MIILTKEQRHIVKSITIDIKKKSKQIITFGGLAGTGKTTCLSYLTEVFPTYAICAYTGKAANVLRKKGMDASTIHSLIYKPMIKFDGTIEFVLKNRAEASWEGFVVDEASMVSKEIYDDLLTFDMPIIFVGDHGQLEPVGSNVNVMVDPMYRLETVHRNAGEIAHFAAHLRNGNHPRTFAVTEKVSLVTPSEVSDDLLLNVDQMICAYNKTRVQTNERVRLLQKRSGLVEVGERVMCLRNNKMRGLFNGMQGEVTAHHDKWPRFDFTSDGMTYPDILYDANQFGQEKSQFEFGKDTPDPFDYAYCVTAHKSQGDEWDSVMVFEQHCDKWDHRRWAYTAASRAREKLFWITQKQFIPAWLA